MSAYSDFDTAGTRNVDELERAASLAGGAYLAWKGIGRDSMMGLALMGLGAVLMHRGVTGHCRVYESIGASTASRRPYEGDEEDDWERDADADEVMDEDDEVQEAGKESFPASDPPSYMASTGVPGDTPPPPKRDSDRG